MATDRLTLAHAFEEAGMPREQAEEVASAIGRFVEGSAATKMDVERAEAAVRADLKTETTAIRTDLANAVHSLTLRGFFAAVSFFFALLAALHYWPPR